MICLGAPHAVELWRRPPAQPVSTAAQAEHARQRERHAMSDHDDTHTATDTPQHTNRLIHETSPYLQQHAHNPVDWYPWGQEALAKALADDRPIMLSVGYSACHWCHRMREESFENEATARYLNDHFVSIKVDREERPDIDALYMDAVQALTGSGGWPMTVFLTPDGAPFFGGTYFPPVDRYGMPGFATLLRNIIELYQTRRDEVNEQAEAFRDFYRRQGAMQLVPPANTLGAEAAGATPTIPAATLTQAANAELAQADWAHGGFGRAPKFPHPMGLEFLLRMESRRRATDAAHAPAEGLRDDLLSAITLTLDKMAAGGIYDQIGGGFHRYATDAIWLVPHFEKMLYDNALLARVYLHAWQLTGEARYRRICEETLEYVLREMTGTEGGFYSTQDADSEGAEGKFYVWSPEELRAALGDDDAAVVERLWGVSERGNFEGKNILHLARTEAEAPAATGKSQAEISAIVAHAREELYRVRSKRVWPGRDEKVITAWNGLLMRALAEAGQAFENKEYTAAARTNANFLLDHLFVDGRLHRTWRDTTPGGTARGDAYLEDYAALVNGLLSVYEATAETRYFVQARALADDLIARFWDEGTGGFFDTAADHEQLIGRPRELTDNATPAGASLAAEALLRLTAFTGETSYREYSARVLGALAPSMAKSPSAFGHFLCALDDLIGPFYEVAVVGRWDGAPEAESTRALRFAISQRFAPRLVYAEIDPMARGATEAQAQIPLLADRSLVDGQPAGYVCQDFVCQRPVTTPGTLAAALDLG